MAAVTGLCEHERQIMSQKAITSVETRNLDESATSLFVLPINEQQQSQSRASSMHLTGRGKLQSLGRGRVAIEMMRRQSIPEKRSRRRVGAARAWLNRSRGVRRQHTRQLRLCSERAETRANDFASTAARLLHKRQQLVVVL
jgi:hypothetical protein